jgi:hypothetical protein
MTFPTPHIGHSRHGLFFTRPDCQSNAEPSEKDHDLPVIRTRDIWSSSQDYRGSHPCLDQNPRYYRIAVILAVILSFLSFCQQSSPCASVNAQCVYSGQTRLVLKQSFRNRSLICQYIGKTKHWWTKNCY